MASKYLPLQEDIDWATRGALARIKNGCCVSFVQQSFEDAGFMDLKLISFGGDNVFFYPQEGGAVFDIISEIIFGLILDHGRRTLLTVMRGVHG